MSISSVVLHSLGRTWTDCGCAWVHICVHCAYTYLTCVCAPRHNNDSNNQSIIIRSILWLQIRTTYTTYYRYIVCIHTYHACVCAPRHNKDSNNQSIIIVYFDYRYYIYYLLQIYLLLRDTVHSLNLLVRQILRVSWLSGDWNTMISWQLLERSLHPVMMTILDMYVCVYTYIIKRTLLNVLY